MTEPGGSPWRAKAPLRRRPFYLVTTSVVWVSNDTWKRPSPNYFNGCEGSWWGRQAFWYSGFSGRNQQRLELGLGGNWEALKETGTQHYAHRAGLFAHHWA